ncbi:MAG: spore photoproduct lyase family protein [Candidatus Omnitrophota bacterium]
MTIQDNRIFIESIGSFLSGSFPVDFGVNKKNQLVRLIYEICMGQGMALDALKAKIDPERMLESGKGELFHRLKKYLLDMRYPSAAGEKGDPRLMPLKISERSRECSVWDFRFNPGNIFIEEGAMEFEWTRDFLKNFPSARCHSIKDLKEGLVKIQGGDPLARYDARRDNLFLVKAKSAHIKICPCTKGYKRCGYWILNIGFGCPIDCSYCYLQQYSNSPGIVLAVNIESYFDAIIDFDKSLSGMTRIGTGEFTDSLALDKYTKYSSQLIPFFRKTKNLVLELKTKVADITNVLKEEPHGNVVVSWSINTPGIAEKYEKGASCIRDRINSAERAAEKGFGIGFHFDPIVFYPGWEDEYRKVINDMFSHESIRKNTRWISLGTLRYTPGLKQIAEERFGDNLMYYQGEFVPDTDGKLRYPRAARMDIYKKMVQWIRAFDTSAWIYLCMEPASSWQEIDL